MSSLKSQIDWCRRTQFALTVGVGVFAMLFYLLGYRPREAYEQRLDDEIVSAQQDLAVSQAQARHLPEVAADLERLRIQLADFQNAPAIPDLGEFLRQVTAMSRQTGLQKLEVNFASGTHHSDQFTQLPATLKFQGDFLSACDFLRRLEEMHRLMRMNSIAIHGLDGGRGGVEVTMSMDIYFSER
jgi:Tfp pilus assembly protein PilO